MIRIYELKETIKTASNISSVSRFYSAATKGIGSKHSKKSLEVKMQYKSQENKAVVDVFEYTKKGHKHRKYNLINIDYDLYKKIESLINGGKWNLFFAIVNKHRITR
jgi:hypothetical protein